MEAPADLDPLLALLRPVAVFASGLGSYVAVAALQRRLPGQNLRYVAERASFPCGAKGRAELRVVLQRTTLPMRCLLLLIAQLFALPALAQVNPAWTTPLPPFQIADGLYYVGSEDLAAYLVTTPAGNILINANLESSPPQIRTSIETLGFQWADTKILLNGQAHFDHMGGAAEILRETHAQNMVMEGDADVVESGGRTDFLAASGSVPSYPPAHVDRVLHDGDTVNVGGITLTAHKTAGHTRGCTTWTFPVHLPGEPSDRVRNVVIVGGVSFWADFHFTDRPGQPTSYPGIAQDLPLPSASCAPCRATFFLARTAATSA